MHSFLVATVIICIISGCLGQAEPKDSGDPSDYDLELGHPGYTGLHGLYYPKRYRVSLMERGSDGDSVEFEMLVEGERIASIWGISDHVAGNETFGCRWDIDIKAERNECNCSHKNIDEDRWWPDRKTCEDMVESHRRYTASNIIDRMRQNRWGCFDPDRETREETCKRKGKRFLGYETRGAGSKTSFIITRL